MGRAVDEVGVGDDGGGEADNGTVEADDEDLWVRGKGFCDVEVEGDKGLEELLAGFVGIGGVWSAYGDVCAAVFIYCVLLAKNPGYGKISISHAPSIHGIFFNSPSTTSPFMRPRERKGKVWLTQKRSVPCRAKQ